MNGPETAREWQAAIDVLHEALGIRGRVPSYVSEVFIDVEGVSFLPRNKMKSKEDYR